MEKNRFINKKNINLMKFAILVIFAILIILIGIQLIGYIDEFSTQQGRDKLVEIIRSKGVAGAIVFLLLQIAQIIIFIIPGEVIEVVGGIVYGTWGGFFICMLGIIIGSNIIFYLVKFLGYDFITQLISVKKFEKLSFLKDNSKIELLVFILFFIPGTPKDALTYFAPFTNLSARKFIAISTIARIPSVISSTFVGSSLQTGNLKVAVIAYIVIAVLAIIGIALNKKIINKYNK